MHEFAIVYDIYEQTARLAGEHEADIITEVQVEVGRLRQVIDEVMQTAWQSVTRDTIAATATLILIPVDIQLRCRPCQEAYGATPDNFLCPRCQAADAEVLAGDAIILKSITCFKNDDLTESA